MRPTDSQSVDVKGAPPSPYIPGHGYNNGFHRNRITKENYSSFVFNAFEQSSIYISDNDPLKLVRSGQSNYVSLTFQIEMALEGISVLPNIEFTVTQDNAGNVIFRNIRQNEPWQITIVIVPTSKTFTLSLSLNYRGLDVKTALDGTKFLRKLSNGGELQIIEAGSGTALMRAFIPSEVYTGPE